MKDQESDQKIDIDIDFSFEPDGNEPFSDWGDPRVPTEVRYVDVPGKYLDAMLYWLAIYRSMKTPVQFHNWHSSVVTVLHWPAEYTNDGLDRLEGYEFRFASGAEIYTDEWVVDGVYAARQKEARRG